MLELYRKMYATLAGHVDTSVSELANIAMLGPRDREHVLKVAEDLRQVLLEAEELYLDAEEHPQP